MGIKTAIEYCDSTVNPIMGCTGCELYDPDPALNHCYAATLVNRYAGRKGWPESFNRPEIFPERLEKALKWSDLTGRDRPDKPWLNGKPRVVFVNDLSDGFCPDIDPEEWLAPYLGTMAESPHFWLLLTKWPRLMRKFFERHPVPANFGLGTTVLRQKDEWRIVELLKIEAGIRFVSCEPLLESLDISFYLHPHTTTTFNPLAFHNAPALSWVVCGGESGPGARPMLSEWILQIIRQCQAANVPTFTKQLGIWQSKYQKLSNLKGANPKEWPLDLQVREFPNVKNG